MLKISNSFIIFINKERTQNKDKCSLNLIDISSWEDRFRNLLTETRTKFKSAEDKKKEERVKGDAMTEEFPTDITVEEVKKALHGMKNGKASLSNMDP